MLVFDQNLTRRPLECSGGFLFPKGAHDMTRDELIALILGNNSDTLMARRMREAASMLSNSVIKQR